MASDALKEAERLDTKADELESKAETLTREASALRKAAELIRDELNRAAYERENDEGLRA